MILCVLSRVRLVVGLTVLVVAGCVGISGCSGTQPSSHAIESPESAVTNFLEGMRHDCKLALSYLDDETVRTLEVAVSESPIGYAMMQAENLTAGEVVCLTFTERLLDGGVKSVRTIEESAQYATVAVDLNSDDASIRPLRLRRAGARWVIEFPEETLPS